MINMGEIKTRLARVVRDQRGRPRQFDGQLVDDAARLVAEVERLRGELEAAHVALDDMRFAYVNKDEDFPHQYEKLALMEVERIIGAWGERQKMEGEKDE